MHVPKLRRTGINKEIAEEEQDEHDQALEQIKERSSIRRRAKKQFLTARERFYYHLNKQPASQWAIWFYSFFILVWTVCVTGIMLDFSLTYLVATVDIDREWYVVNAALALAQAQAARALIAAHHARDALCVAVHAGIIGGSTDYAAIERVLAPALLASPFVSAVEMMFSDSVDLLSVGYREAADGRWLLTMKSTAAECFLLGVEGCLEQESRPADRPDWLSDNEKLPTESAAGYGSSGRVEEENAMAAVRAAWEEEPVLLPTQWAPDGSAKAWAPSYRLRYRCGHALAVGGRVSLELGRLSGGGEDGWFSDPRLGEEGQTYLVDRGGSVLASRAPEELLVVEAGRLRFARIWELEGKAWAQELKSAFSGDGGIPDTKFLHAGGSQVALQPLLPPLEHFGVVVVAPSGMPFTSAPLFATSTASLIVALVPYCIGVCAGAVVFVRQWQKNRELRMLDPTRDVRPRTYSSEDGTGSRRLRNLWPAVFSSEGGQ